MGSALQPPALHDIARPNQRSRGPVRSMITETHEVIAGTPGSGLLIIADHASSEVPAHIDLRICPTAYGCHVAIDICIDPLVRALAPRFGAPGIVARGSRRGIDFNRT